MEYFTYFVFFIIVTKSINFAMANANYVKDDVFVKISEVTSVSSLEVKKTKTKLDCARECLESSYCSSYGFDSEYNCYLQVSICGEASPKQR